MDKFTGSAQASNGDLIVSGTPTIRVTLANSDTLATIFSSDSTAATKANPFTLPGNGRIEFHARNGKYRVKQINGAVETLIDEVVLNAGVTYGTLAGRPAAGSADRLYVSSDAGTYYDSGTAWVGLPVNLASLRTQAISGGYPMLNGTLVPSVAANALSIAIKTLAGTDPSPTDPVYFLFRNATAATGDYTVLALTAATSFTVSSGSTLGVSVASTPFRGWVVAFNDAGTLRLGVINCLTTAAGAGSGTDATVIYPLARFGIASSTAEGGAGAADGSRVFYTAAAVTSKAYTVIGYFTYETGLAVAGSYAAVPTRLELFRPGVPLPGTVIQQGRSTTGAVATGTTILPDDDTIPQSTEGDQFLSLLIAPTSAANVVEVDAVLSLAHNGAAVSQSVIALFQDTVANALAAVAHGYTNSGITQSSALKHRMLAATTAEIAFKIRAGNPQAGTTTVNGSAGVRKLGGVMSSYLAAEEIMA